MNSSNKIDGWWHRRESFSRFVLNRSNRIIVMRVIAVTNQKGGSCKTTTAVNLAAALSANSKRVLVIDLDPQASASVWFGTKDGGKVLLEVFTHDRNFVGTIVTTEVPGVELVPASRWLLGVEKALAGEVGAEMILRSRVQELPTERWDYVLFDCPPSVGFLSLTALIAANEILMPVEASAMAMGGVASLLGTIDKIRERLNPQLRLSGVLACRVDLRTHISRDVVASLEKHFGETLFKTVIRETVRLKEAWSRSQPITVYAPTSTGAADFLSLAQEVMQRTKEEGNP
jgi:chromosome partitioning protein